MLPLTVENVLLGSNRVEIRIDGDGAAHLRGAPEGLRVETSRRAVRQPAQQPRT